MNTGTSERLQTPAFPFITTLAAFLAFGLLPTALAFGTGSMVFQITSYAHVVVFAIAALLAAQYFVRQVLASASSPILPLALFFIFCVLILLNASPPPTNPEALSGPLYTIKYWLASGSMAPIPWNYDSYAPHLPSLAQAIFLPVIGHMSFPIYSLLSLIIASAIVGLLAYLKTKSSLLSACGFLLFFTLPLFQKLSVNYSLDGSLALYTGLAVLYLLRWMQNKNPVKALVALGIALGALGASGFRGMGLSLLIMGLLPLLAVSKHVSGGRLLFALLIVPFFSALGILPWLGRNLMWTMNPIFPLGSSFLGASGSGITFQSVEPILINHWLVALNYSTIDLLLLPLQYIVPDAESTALLGAKLSPLLLLAVVAIKDFRHLTVAIPFGITALYCVAALILYPPNTTALTPVIPLLCYLSIVGLDHAARWCKEYYRLLPQLLLGIHAVFALYFGLELVTDIRPFAFLQEKDESKYLASKIQEFPIITRLNRTLPPLTGKHTDLTTYLIGVYPAFYYYDIDIRKDSTARPDFLLKQLAAHTKSNELRAAFIHQGMQIIFAHKETITKVIASLEIPAEKVLWKSFVTNHLETLFEDDNFIVWKVKTMEEESAITEAVNLPEPSI